MKLNLYVFREDMKISYSGEHICCEPHELTLMYPLLCHEPPVDGSPSVLYIFSSDNLPDPRSMSQAVSFLCIGRPDEIWFSSRSNFLYFDDPSVTEYYLMNETIRIFYSYEHWEEQLQEAVDKELPLKEFASRSRSIIGNPIYLQGGGFRALFYYMPHTAKDSPEYNQYRKNYYIPDNTTLPAEAINMMIADPEFNHAAEALEPTIYAGDPFGFRSLFYNIRSDEGHYLARVLYDEIILPLNEKDFVSIKILGHYLCKALSRRNSASFTRMMDLDSTLTNLLEHHLLPESKISEALDYLSWKMFDKYVCLILWLKTQEDANTALGPIAIELSKLTGNDCYTVYQGRIIFVFNLTKQDCTRTILLKKLTPFLRDNLLSSAMSSVYHDFKNLYYYYHQAEIARSVGEKKDPTKWNFFFEEYLPDFLIRQCMHKTVPEVIIPEGLKLLIEHDKQKSSDYTTLLYLYLKNERNIAATIREGYLHRNTFLYRINRIQEILKMNLDDPDIRLILMIAFKVMQNKGMFPFGPSAGILNSPSDS